MRATAWRIGLAALLIFTITGGGRIVGSDEVTMFEVSRALLHGGIAVPEGATLTGPDGRSYSKNAAFQAVVALPLVAVSEGLGGFAGHDPARQMLAVRFGTSFFNAIITALLLAMFYVTARHLAIRPRVALAATVLLGFATPVWVYAKSFMAEPLQALGLLLALAGSAGVLPGLAAGLGMFIAVSAKLSMLPLAIAASLVALGRKQNAWLAPVVGLLAALAGHAIYNVARFGNPFESGYGAQATASAYTTPLVVGLYGLLLSSGKGVMWFAPALWIAIPSWLAGTMPPRFAPAGSGGRTSRFRLWLDSLDAAARVRWGALLIAAAALLLYGRFQHWAGDGSFGPRYLLPVLPAAFLVVALTLEGAGRTTRRVATVLGILGFLVQVGGVTIYFGAQMREAGDYPYTLPLEHPRFMSDSHFNPRFSPIADHWRMFLRNGAEHLRGEEPRIGGTATTGEATSRLGIDAADQERLLHAIDFWWLYLGYAGLPKAPVWAAVIVLKILFLFAAFLTWRACKREALA